MPNFQGAASWCDPLSVPESPNRAADSYVDASRRAEARQAILSAAVALRDPRGLLEAANGGMLLLDESGDLPRMVRTALLRTLQRRGVLRIGEITPRRIDVRLLTATHRNLETEAREGRIRVGRIRIPALRERVADIPLLAGQYLHEMASLTGKPLAGSSWPDNVLQAAGAVGLAPRAGLRRVGVQW